MEVVNMKITNEINGVTCLMEIEGAIVGTHAEDLDQLIRLSNFARSGIINLVLNLSRATMIDSIGLEAIKHAQEQRLRVSILNPRGVVKDMLERAMLKERLSVFLQIVEKDRRSSQRKEFPIPLRVPVSC
jgi:anti-anti-sigma regulatory factor